MSDNEPNKQMSDGTKISRRGFISWMSIGWLTFAATMGGFATMVGRFLFPNVLFEPSQSFKAGVPGEYQPNSVSTAFKAKQRVWIVRTEDRVFALLAKCTHLGCTPNWLANENKFKCPCHGSGFRITGINYEGPAPRPLERVKISLADDGRIQLDKAVTFRYEKGDWEHPDSYLMV
jgi:cytochrome b6-f complex iron-sulfur subunit